MAESKELMDFAPDEEAVRILSKALDDGVVDVPDDNLNKAVRLSGILGMFGACRKGCGKPSSAFLVFNTTTGRYTNESIQAWMDSYADGLIYGVRIPRYSYSTTTEATKTDANEGLVLEPSTFTTCGRNDYLNKKLFFCPRVNGGVDADGMPYVTAIEGIDDRFDCKAHDTWALTPVYYFKYTKTDDFITKQFSDTAQHGLHPCYGAYTSQGQLRPYILRACYLIENQDASSKSGVVPSADMSHLKLIKKMDDRSDGLGFLTSGDWIYQIDFMQLMLGTKSLTVKALGYQGYPLSATMISGTDDSGFKIAAHEGSWIKPGFNLNISGDGVMYANAQVISVEADPEDASILRVYVDIADSISSNMANAAVKQEKFFRNGCLDNVLGSYGGIDAESMTDGHAPFKFQNMELCNGMEEIVVNVKSGLSDEPSDVIRIAYNLKAFEKTWNEVEVCSLHNPVAGYVSDFDFYKAVFFPTGFNASSKTGYGVHAVGLNGYNSQMTVGVCVWPKQANAKTVGMGYMAFNSFVNDAWDTLSSRASAICDSAAME